MGLLYLTPLKSAAAPPPGFTDVNSLTFSGVNGGEVPDAVGFSSEMSVSVWVKTSTSDTIIVSKLETGSQYSYNAAVSPTGTARWVVSSDGTTGGGAATTLIGNISIDDGNWHHVVFTFKGATTTQNIYVDGTLDVTTSSSQPSMFTSAIPIGIGIYHTGGIMIPIYVGKMDWLSTYSVELTLAQVVALYNGGVPPNNMTSLSSYSSCAMWLPIGEGSDSASTLFDQKNTNDATLFGFVGGDFTADIP